MSFPREAMIGHDNTKEGGYKVGDQTSGDSDADTALMSCICIFLESNPYFVTDVFGVTDPAARLQYLLGLAKVASDLPEDSEELKVNEELCVMAKAAAQQWPKKGLLKAVVPRQKQFKLKAFLLTEGAKQILGGLEVLPHLMRLKFYQGPISVFKVDLPRAVQDHGLAPESQETILDAYAAFVREEWARRGQPQDVWDVKPCGRSFSVFARCAVTCAVHYCKQEGQGLGKSNPRSRGHLYFLVVWNQKRDEVKFPGGDILHLSDQDLAAAAKREFLEEVHAFGISESDLAEPFDDRVFMYCKAFDQPNSKYAVIPYVFVKVKEGFFRSTFETEATTEQRYLMEVDERLRGFVTDRSDKDLKRQHHMGDGSRWLEHSKWGWARAKCPVSRPGKLSYAQLVAGQKQPKVCFLDVDVLIRMSQSRGQWAEFTSRFLA
eukprot:s266_g11.t1